MARYLLFDAYGLAEDQPRFGRMKRIACNMEPAANGDIYIRFDAKSICFIRRIRNTDVGIAYGSWADREALEYLPENSRIEVM